MLKKQFTPRSKDNLGPNLSRIMDKKGTKVNWLAKEVGVSVRTVQSWMSYCGKNPNGKKSYGRFPELESLLLLSRALHTSIDAFLR